MLLARRLLEHLANRKSGNGGLLNHVEKELKEKFNSLMVSKLNTAAAPLPFMIFDILISIARFFFSLQ